MKRFLLIARNTLEPFKIDGVWINLFILMVRGAMGAALAFFYAPKKFGTPWTPELLDLPFLQVSDEFIAHIAKQGYPFNIIPEVLAWSICFMEAFGGLLLIFGLNTRMTAFFIFLTMTMGIFFRTWDGTWSILPVFIFFCLSLFFIGFGSGKFGLDHYIVKRYL